MEFPVAKHRWVFAVCAALLHGFAGLSLVAARSTLASSSYIDSHFHLTNYIQEGTARSPAMRAHRAAAVARLFGTDEAAPTEQAKSMKVDEMDAPLFAKLTPEASEKLRKGNYERLFDAARRKVRA